MKNSHGRLGHGMLNHTWIITLAAVAMVATTIVFIDSHRVESASGAGHPQCSEAVDRLPDELASNARDWALGEGVASWGDQTAIFRCGVDALAPTVNLCMSVDGIDWVLDEKTLDATGVSVLTTYGRSPAIQVSYFGAREDVGEILVELKTAVARIQQKRKCIGYGDAP